MTSGQMYNFVKRISYKPGWRFVIDVNALRDFEVTLVCLVATTDVRTLKPIELSLTKKLDYREIDSERSLMYRIEYLIKEMEQHEIDEWLKLDGVNVREPHPERKV